MFPVCLYMAEPGVSHVAPCLLVLTKQQLLQSLRRPVSVYWVTRMSLVGGYVNKAHPNMGVRS